MTQAIFLLGMPGGMDMILILAVVLLLFGGKKIPELMQGIGKGMREFNDAKDKMKEHLEEGMKPEPKMPNAQIPEASATEMQIPASEVHAKETKVEL